MEIYWIWLSLIQGIGQATQKELLRKFLDPISIYRAPEEELVDTIGIKRAQMILKARSLVQAQCVLKACHRQDIQLLTATNPYYPQLVKQTNAPILFFYKGKVRESSTGIGIIGTRRCTDYGKRVTQEATEYLVSHDIPIISGMSKGIEAHAHTVCIRSGGYPVAIVGFSLDTCYPAEHQSLLNKIIDTGVVLTPFAPGTPYSRGNIAIRNTCLAAWSESLLITEAGEKSGVFTVVSQAESLKRTIYAAPNSIFAEESKGCNALIKNGIALPYLYPDQLILTDNAPNPIIQKKQPHRHGSKIQDVQNIFVCTGHIEDKLIGLIRKGVRSIDDLHSTLPLEDKGRTIEVLCMLELEGMIRIDPGGRIDLVPVTPRIK